MMFTALEMARPTKRPQLLAHLSVLLVCTLDRAIDCVSSAGREHANSQMPSVAVCVIDA
jgi:hypothetical protein